jgi:cyclase
LHVAAGHTDGDVLVYFKGSDVIHMGDVFVGQYPIIDTARGGSYLGLIKTLNAAIVLVGPDTTIVPGHGPISERVDMIDYRDMLQDIYDRVSALHSVGNSLSAIIASRPSEAHDRRWAGGRGSEGIIRSAYQEVAGN